MQAGGGKRPLSFLVWVSGPIRVRIRLLFVRAREPEVAWTLSWVRGVELARGGADRGFRRPRWRARRKSIG